tara:strand:- start:151 stop:708 length:558 start_codon:yes stop_codon:yes gene_type:complete
MAKTLVELENLDGVTTNESVFVFEDGASVTFDADNNKIICADTGNIFGAPANFEIHAVDTTKFKLYSGVTAPSDWIGRKYKFDGSSWTFNDLFIELHPSLESSYTFINASLDTSQTTLSVEAMSGLTSDLVVGDILKIVGSDERMKLVTINSATQLTVERGYNSTTATTHPSPRIIMVEDKGSNR